MKNTLVSIAMATYNGEKFLRGQLDSIYAQTYKYIELIVVDDCSTDSTVSILEEYKKKYGLKYYQNNRNIGFVKNFEKAISLCTGDYIALSDQDDIWEFNKIEILIRDIGNNLLIHSDCKIIDGQNNIIKRRWKEHIGYRTSIMQLMFANCVTGCTVLFKRELFEKIRVFPNGLIYHDWFLAIMAAKENKITYTEKTLVRYRQHENQDTGIPKHKKTFPLKRIGIQIKLRLNNIEFERYTASKKHIENLKVLKAILEEDSKYLDLVSDAIIYYENYLLRHIHLKTFLIGLKYHKTIYPERNFFYIRNILNDLVG